MTLISEPALQATREIPYTTRAKRQDAGDAMANDLVRGLVELITNSDDAYVRARRKGSITVEAEHGRSGVFNRVIVRDQATGMTREAVESQLLVMGARASGHDSGQDTRGLHGRGAKDVAFFGKATFDTISGGEFSSVTIDGETFNSTEPVTRAATATDCARLQIPPGGSGTHVTVFVKRAAHSVPLHKKLAERLSRHFQLRDIMTDPKTEVMLADLTKGGVPERLRYQPPFFSELVLEEDVDIPDYPASCHLEIRKSEKPFEDDRSASRDGGILIVGRHGILDCTYFDLEGRAGALWFSGRLKCSYIDDLHEEYDDRHEPAGPTKPATVLEDLNPTALITRRRDGLERNHPFAVELRKIVEDRLRPLVEAEEAAAKQRAHGANEQTQRRLRDAATKLAELYRELARQQELEVEDTGGPSPEMNTPIALTIVPDTVTLYPGDEKTFSVFAWPEAHEAGAIPTPGAAQIRVDLPEVASVATNTIDLVPDKREPRRLRGTFKVTAEELDATIVVATAGPYSAEAIIEVVEPPIVEPLLAPERLVFDQQAYSVRVGRRRRMILWAPNDVIAAEGNEARIVVTVGSISVPDRAVFEQVATETRETWYQAEVPVHGSVACVAKVRAELGSQLAVARLTITDPDGANPWDFELTGHDPSEYPSTGRAEWSTVGSRRTLLIHCGHPSLRRYFGSGPDLEHQNEAECRMLIAEILSDELAIDLLKKTESDRAGVEVFSDVHSYDVKRRHFSSQFLKVAHQALVPEIANG